MGEERNRGAAGMVLVSTHTIDCLPDPSGTGMVRLPGGPAHYIGEALERQQIEYTLITGERAITEVVRTDEGDQQYIIPALPPISLPSVLVAPAVIMSPIMQEIDREKLPLVRGLLAVDLQGFVREPGRPTGSSSRRFDLRSLIERADVIKAAPDELERLTPESLAALGRAILLVTEGARGVRLECQGKSSFIAARRVKAGHTIGAGDTFLGAFVPALLDGKNPEEAAEQAARFTEETLQTRFLVRAKPQEARTEV